MAYPIANGSILELTLKGKHEGQEVMNVLHYRNTTPSTLTDGALAAITVMEQANEAGGLASLWKACLSAQVTELTMRAQWISPSRWAYITTTITGGSGTIAGNAMPVNTAISITRRGEAANRHNVGTLHIPGVPATAIVNGVLQPLFIDAYNEFAAATLQPLIALDPPFEMVPVLLNRTEVGASPVPQSYIRHDYTRVMRRRTVGVGS